MIKFPQHKSGLYLTHNDHTINYHTVADEIKDRSYYDLCSWVSQEERQKAIETNELWTLQWYPRTPIGSYAIHASTLEALMEYVNANFE